MMMIENVNPDRVTLVSLVFACAQLCSVKLEDPQRDVFGASHVIGRLMFLLIDSSLVNFNARDRWDTVAHYYGCLFNQIDAARMLLESGAICFDHTFDGDKCRYSVKKLLKAFEARPPLGLFEAALRDT
ncbi:hypothetical protein Ddye_000244 [Dipteronia dyeriana]|uniref:Uncharacterized protein n=1 Tax=Dipteronia dyeriana TaxID=168575 RepID=A0AAD9XLY7_9ROSI|nr:hypothetical protein Ddye_000244 [Dipteronia dyeriana]